eukprot:5556766-Amphidinium_carterae.1
MGGGTVLKRVIDRKRFTERDAVEADARRGKQRSNIVHVSNRSRGRQTFRLHILGMRPTARLWVHVAMARPGTYSS